MSSTYSLLATAKSLLDSIIDAAKTILHRMLVGVNMIGVHQPAASSVLQGSEHFGLDAANLQHLFKYLSGQRGYLCLKLSMC